jgi:hypothetical protein
LLAWGDEKRPSAALPSSFDNDVPSGYALSQDFGPLHLGIFDQGPDFNRRRGVVPAASQVPAAMAKIRRTF